MLTHPVVVWFLYFGAMSAFFLTALINFAMVHMALMDAINVVFLLGGCFYWWPLVGLDPIVHWRMGYGARIATLAIGVPFEAFLGIAIMSDRSPIASMYSLASTHTGGALLWAATELSTFAGLIPVFLQWQRADERAGARADARAVRAEAAAADDVAVSAVSDGPDVRTSAFVDQFRPLLQPGNSSWEAMWRAKAGFVPTSRRPQPPGRRLGGASPTATDALSRRPPPSSREGRGDGLWTSGPLRGQRFVAAGQRLAVEEPHLNPVAGDHPVAIGHHGQSVGAGQGAHLVRTLPTRGPDGQGAVGTGGKYGPDEVELAVGAAPQVDFGPGVEHGTEEIVVPRHQAQGRAGKELVGDQGRDRVARQPEDRHSGRAPRWQKQTVWPASPPPATTGRRRRPVFPGLF